jgi:hypothetical protein
MRLVIAAAVVFGLGACVAAPQRKVAVLGVERASGASDRALEAWVAERVDRRYDVVPKRTYWKKASRLGAEKITANNVRRVAKRLDLDAIVYGEVSKKKRGRAWLTLWVHDGRTGKVIETHGLAVKRGKVSSKQARRIDRELLASLPAVDDVADVDRELSREKPRRERSPRKPARAEVAANKVDREDLPDEEPARRLPPPSKVTPSKVTPSKVTPSEVPTKRPPPTTMARAEVKPAKVKPAPAAKPAPPAKPKQLAKPVFEPADQADRTKYDGEGQALDEEMPDILH